jgi:hypothetical protein
MPAMLAYVQAKTFNTYNNGLRTHYSLYRIGIFCINILQSYTEYCPSRFQMKKFHLHMEEIGFGGKSKDRLIKDQ